MKPVVIIAIAIVCSVVAVLGVLVILQEITNYQSQIAFDEYQVEVSRLQTIENEKQQAIYDKNREACVYMFSNVMSMIGERNPYQDCLNYGIDFAVESEKRACEYMDYPYDDLGFAIDECKVRIAIKYLETLEYVQTEKLTIITRP